MTVGVGAVLLADCVARAVLKGARVFRARQLETDHDTRVQMVHELQQIILDDAVYLIPYYQGNIEAVRTDTFTGWYEGEATFGLGDPTSLVYVHPVD